MKRYILTLMICIAGFYGFSQDFCKLQIEIVNLRSNKGDVLIEIFDTNQNSIVSKKVKISDNKCFVTIDSLHNEQYAIQYMHDENSNGKFDTNFVGIPLEGYGISNDAYGNFGPDKFDKWLFTVNKLTKVVLTTKYTF